MRRELSIEVLTAKEVQVVTIRFSSGRVFSNSINHSHITVTTTINIIPLRSSVRVRGDQKKKHSV
jgi:hypothetical protein